MHDIRESPGGSAAEDATGRTGSRTTRGHRGRRITPTELAKRLSDVLDRAHSRGEMLLVERGGKPLCQLAPVPVEPDLQLSELVNLLGSLQSAGDEWAQAVAERVAEQDVLEESRRKGRSRGHSRPGDGLAAMFRYSFASTRTRGCEGLTKRGSTKKTASRRRSVGATNVEPECPELVIGLAAAVGTPLERVQTLLAEQLERLGYDTQVLHLSDYTRQFRLTSPLPGQRAREANRIDSMMNRGNEARSNTGRNDILALCAIADIHSRREGDASTLPNQAFVLRQLKHPDEVYLLRKTYGEGFHLLGLYSPRRVREDHLRTRGANDRETERLIRRDENEPSESGQHLRDTFHLSDVFLEISDRENPVEEKLERFFDLLFGRGVISPTVDEFGMFHAQAAALRSAQLGRQVGAAILSERGDVIATGTNDVPRAGGGLYWEHDENDARDHIRGRDSADEAEEHLLQELAERLEPGWAEASQSARSKLAQKYASRLKSSRLTSLTEFGRAVHAEAEALLSAARMGVSPKDAFLYCTTFPCHVCARHVVAAGLRQVMYIEPYPKSRALELHEDSISIEEDRADRVVFKPFVGVAPRRFARLFSMVSEEGAEIRRKDAEGRPLSSRAGLRLKLPYFSALDREKLAAEELETVSTD